MVDFPSVVIALDRESQSMTRLAREMSAASSLTPENTLLDRGCVHAAPGCTSLLLSTEVEVVLSQRCVYIYMCVCVCVRVQRVCTVPHRYLALETLPTSGQMPLFHFFSRLRFSSQLLYTYHRRSSFQRVISSLHDSPLRNQESVYKL